MLSYLSSNTIPAVTTGCLAPVEGLFTSESVGDGHPDKICDQLSDAVLDAALSCDPNARVAVEAAIKGNSVWLFGELSGSGLALDYRAIVSDVLTSIGHIALVGQQHLGRRPIGVHDRHIALEVRNFAACQRHRYGQAQRIDAEMDLGRKATF